MTERVPKQVSDNTNTRDRLLTAAERLLLEGRYDAVSVRGICAEAGANPAAVHYHFGSKDALVAALLEERLGPVWESRLSAVTSGRGSLAEVVDAVIEPFVALSADPVGRLHLRLLAQFVLGRHVTEWRQPWFLLDSWVGLLPGVSERESRRRWMLAFDLVIMRFGSAEHREMSQEAVATLRDFVVAGLTAPTGEKR
ncbi:TetR/AcrR family transcriptional regulator [Nocardia barduliensis]|uniref:TetR/AcrR family transcriptional regulator n=1 Tax=Nocardia barduliensis TaxID=2736643 RepID=UPI001C2DABCD|nr:TetR/AcrR family transcriptional regulator [Nocardia barduliensis]